MKPTKTRPSAQARPDEDRDPRPATAPPDLAKARPDTGEASRNTPPGHAPGSATGLTPHLAAQDEIAREIARLETLARILDAQFRIPVINYRFGYDALLGLVPGVGDALAAAPSAWMIWRAHKMGMPTHRLARMAANTGADFVFGSVPLLGNIFDLVFKSNLRNMDLLRRHLEAEAEAETRRTAAS